MILRFAFLLFFALVLSAAPARAQEYADPTWENLSRTLVRFNAIQLSDPLLIDEYAIITECDLYKAFFKDDFKWNQVRQAVRDDIAKNVATFPTKYHYDVKLQLDRYDFDRKLYRFAPKSEIKNVNTFVLYSVAGINCGTSDVQYMPRTFRAVLVTPLYVEGLPLSETDGEQLLKQMVADGNTSHFVHARFNLSILYIDPIRKNTFHSGSDSYTRYWQSAETGPGIVHFDVRLDSIDFYADTHLSRLIYEYTP